MVCFWNSSTLDALKRSADSKHDHADFWIEIYEFAHRCFFGRDVMMIVLFLYVRTHVFFVIAWRCMHPPSKSGGLVHDARKSGGQTRAWLIASKSWRWGSGADVVVMRRPWGLHPRVTLNLVRDSMKHFKRISKHPTQKYINRWDWIKIVMC